MIDKQKLLQWVEKKKYVYSGPYEQFESKEECEGVLMALRMLERAIELGEFEEEVQG